MKKSLFDRIPERILKGLAREKGFLPGPGESIDELIRRLLCHYRRGVEEVAGKGGSILEAANEALRRVRGAVGIPTQEPHGERQPRRDESDEIFATETMARIYEKQGLVEEARSVYAKLREADPDNERWRTELERLEGIGSAAAGPVQEETVRAAFEEPPEVPSVGGDAISGGHVPRQEPRTLLDMEEPPERYGEDELVLLPVGPDDLYACWEVTQGSIDAAAREAGEGGTLVLRLLGAAVNENGSPEGAVRDFEVADRSGEFFFHELNPGCFYRAAVGLKVGWKFHPLVHSGLQATPRTQPGRLREEEWMEIDQKSLLWKRRDAAPVRSEGTSKLSLREKALLRLHAMGGAGASRETGIPEERLAMLFETLEDAAVELHREEASSIDAHS